MLAYLDYANSPYLALNYGGDIVESTSKLKDLKYTHFFNYVTKIIIFIAFTGPKLKTSKRLFFVAFIRSIFEANINKYPYKGYTIPKSTC